MKLFQKPVNSIEIEERECSSCNYCSKHTNIEDRINGIIMCLNTNGFDLNTNDVIIKQIYFQNELNSHLLLQRDYPDKIIKILSIPTISKDGFSTYKGLKILIPNNNIDFDQLVNTCFNLSKFYSDHDIEDHYHNIRVANFTSYFSRILYDEAIIKYEENLNKMSNNSYLRENFQNLNIELEKRILFNPHFFNSAMMAGLLHDIGKLFIPSQILKKPSALTNSEFEIVKTHTTYGGLFLKNFTNLEACYRTAIHHHDKWFENIDKTSLFPIIPKIVMATDIIDAMAIDRPYRSAIEYNKILQMWKGEAWDNKGNFKDYLPPAIEYILIKRWEDLIFQHKKLQLDFSYSNLN